MYKNDTDKEDKHQNHPIVEHQLELDEADVNRLIRWYCEYHAQTKAEVGDYQLFGRIKQIKRNLRNVR